MRIISALLLMATIMATLSVCLSQSDVRCKIAEQIDSFSDFVREPQLTLKTRSSPVVLVAGGGLAGIVASLTAAEEGATVYLVEKSGRLGGNSAKATSGLNAVGTAPQSVYDPTDSCSLYYSDTLCAGLDMNFLELVSALVHDSSDSFDWLTSQHVPLTNVTILGGHSSKRTHYTIKSPKNHPMTAGSQLIYYLNNSISSNPSITVLLNTSLSDVIIHNEKVYAANLLHNGQNRTIRVDSVVLATGGYAGSGEMIAKWAPRLAKLPSTNSHTSAGEGISIGLKAGADIIEMDKVQVHPTAFIDPTDPDNHVKFLAPEALRGAGGMLVNSNGMRFINELLTRKTVSEAMMQEGTCFLVMDHRVADTFGPNFYFYKSRKLIQYYHDAVAAAEDLGIDTANFVKTLKDSGKEPTDAIYIAKVTPAVHYSIGGLRIDADGKVLKPDMSDVVGLFAAGEVSGGLHGADRLGGNSLTECVVMGRRAGKAAVHKISSQVSHIRGLPLEYKLANFITDIKSLVDPLKFELKNNTLVVDAVSHSAVSYLIRNAKKLNVPFAFNDITHTGLCINFTPKINMNASENLKQELLNSRLIPKICSFGVFVDNKGNLAHATHDSPLFELLWSLNTKDVHILDLECGDAPITAVSSESVCSCEVIFKDDNQAIVRNCNSKYHEKFDIGKLPSFTVDDEYTQRRILHGVSFLFNGS